MPFDVGGVPEHDRGGEEVEAGGSVALLFETTVPDFAEPVEEHGASECVACFAFIEPGG